MFTAVVDDWDGIGRRRKSLQDLFGSFGDDDSSQGRPSSPDGHAYLSSLHGTIDDDRNRYGSKADSQGICLIDCSMSQQTSAILGRFQWRPVCPWVLIPKGFLTTTYMQSLLMMQRHTGMLAACFSTTIRVDAPRRTCAQAVGRAGLAGIFINKAQHEQAYGGSRRLSCVACSVSQTKISCQDSM